MSRVSGKLKVHSVRDMWDFFVKEKMEQNPQLSTATSSRGADTLVIKDSEGKKRIVFTYKQFKGILSTYNKQCGEALMEGYQIDLLSGLGYLEIAVVERNPNNLRLNMHESMERKKKLEEEGRLTDNNWKVYYTDDDYLTLNWEKRYTTRNITVYQFKAATGKNGFKKKFSAPVIEKPELKARYTYIPRKRN